MNTPKNTNIDELHSAVKSLHSEWQTPDIWWRGHSQINYKLVSGARRNSCTRIEEKNLAERFIRSAYTRYSYCPTSTEVAEDPRWLFLMQHYRMKTRLLDWTESPLIAIYFFVKEENQKEDGTLLGIEPVDS